MSPEIGIGAPIGRHAGLAGGTAAKDGKEVSRRGEIGVDEDAVARLAHKRDALADGGLD